MRYIHWTPEAIDRLLSLWRQGLSASQIAREMGTTKNSIIGKLHRVRDKTGFCLARPLLPRPPKPQSLFKFSSPKRERKPPMLMRVVPVPESVPVDLVQRTGCCYPTTSEPPHLFCNEPRAAGDYCEYHLRVMYPRRAA